MQGMTVEALAGEAGLNTNTLGRIELTRSDPSWTTVRALAGALAVTLVELTEAVEAHEAEVSAQKQPSNGVRATAAFAAQRHRD
jgi:transcriptional regulator with XRE-family HTH domain